MRSTTVAPPRGATPNDAFPRSAWARTARRGGEDRRRRAVAAPATGSAVRTSTRSGR
ncbi:hypothetical protein LZ318_25005 [Saccharopolyspora indica]|uniref:hypothetical protein n=1 Tax=Saccharopolyspora indica TaxID=1229659 RepID=UPI0022EA6A58|nr:hypothetical protein [Saccharopolyspora indica]MDA3649869.1 hypothetical protein [Saccharopolyspora indica]